MKLNALGLAGALALLALPAIAQSADIIIVRDSSAVAGCTALGEVKASSMMGGILATTGYNKAIERLKGQAQSLGATHILLVDSASGFAGSRMFGNAYRCPVKTLAGE